MPVDINIPVVRGEDARKLRQWLQKNDNRLKAQIQVSKNDLHRGSQAENS